MKNIEQQEKEPVVFRDLRLEDCDDMVEIINALHEEGVSGFSGTTHEKWFSELQKMIEKLEKKEDVCIVAEMDDHIAGWAALRRREKEFSTADLLVLCLAEKARGSGKGSELLQKAITKAQEEWQIEKVVTQTPIKTSEFYKKNDFVETGRSVERKGYVELEKNLE
jgi:predicted GNAT family N-acyltransferase